jgi:hypothetical protein
LWQSAGCSVAYDNYVFEGYANWLYEVQVRIMTIRWINFFPPIRLPPLPASDGDNF